VISEEDVVPQTIERESPVAYYEQLFEILRDRIVGGAIPPEGRLPSEMELTREYGLSRATVRQTMSKLESEGLARRVAHRGFFATSADQAAGWTIQEGFLESQIRQGRTGVDTLVVNSGWVQPPEHVKDALGLGDGAQVFALKRVRSLNGTVAMFSTNWFPADVGRAIAADEAVVTGTGSVNETLRRHGYLTRSAQRVIHSLPAPQEVAGHLAIDVGSPVLRVRSLSWGSNGVRFDYYETWVLTDVIPLEVSVSAG
jgi:GntR family transcriptional regulator